MEAEGREEADDENQKVPPRQLTTAELSDALQTIEQWLQWFEDNDCNAESSRIAKRGIIERVDASEWISPIVVVQKKSGGIRLCDDLREPNKAVIADSFPLPHIDDVLLRFQGASLFCTLDLKATYHQLGLHEDSRDLTTFITHDGLLHFRRVPYGLCSAASAFQGIMTEILQGLWGIVCYLDDIVVFGQSVDEHDRNLDAVLRRLQDYDVTLNKSVGQ
ncbi:hypothetical protein M513_02353 [Trichuris suis]|uniref:Reverse transcriptase domain-containing protein n=1 Tax=Trichuris suis TaxID=68888 RepID=A0A085MHI1_9BILA|nr:hypothetical protein M513_02353 [Trichuris suis]